MSESCSLMLVNCYVVFFCCAKGVHKVTASGPILRSLFNTELLKTYKFQISKLALDQSVLMHDIQ